MPIKWGVDENGDPKAIVSKNLGRPLGSGKPSVPQDALRPQSPESSRLPSDARVATSSGDVWKDAANNIGQVLTGRDVVLDETVLNALRKKSYDVDKIIADPGKYANILQGIRDELNTQVEQYNENMGEFGGTGSVGKHTIDSAHKGEELRSGHPWDEE